MPGTGSQRNFGTDPSRPSQLHLQASPPWHQTRQAMEELRRDGPETDTGAAGSEPQRIFTDSPNISCRDEREGQVSMRGNRGWNQEEKCNDFERKCKNGVQRNDK